MLKTLDEVSGGKERDNPRPPTYTPCILEASFPLLHFVRSAICHSVFVIWHGTSHHMPLPPGIPAPVLEGSWRWWSRWKWGGGLSAPKLRSSTAADLGYRMPMDRRWPTDIYVLGHTGFWKPLNSLLRLNNVSPKKKKRCWFRFFPNVGKSDHKGPALLSWYHLLKCLIALQLFKHFACINCFNPHNNVIQKDYSYPHFTGVKTEA